MSSHLALCSVEIVAPLLRVLEKMHTLSWMHRDIKPENIFLTRRGRLRLGDFGLAMNWEKELPFSRSGTLDYMAPEVGTRVVWLITSGKTNLFPWHCTRLLFSGVLKPLNPATTVCLPSWKRAHQQQSNTLDARKVPGVLYLPT